MIFINPHKCCTFVTEKSCLTSNANLCIIQKFALFAKQLFSDAKLNLKSEKRHFLLCFYRLLILGWKWAYSKCSNTLSMQHR